MGMSAAPHFPNPVHSPLSTVSAALSAPAILTFAPRSHTRGSTPHHRRHHVPRIKLPRAPTWDRCESRELQKHHQNSTKGPPREEERMKIVAGEGKKNEILGGPAEGGPVEGGVGGSTQILDAPTKILNTHHNTTHTHNTPHNTTGDPAQGGLGEPAQGDPWPKKQDMSNKLFPKSSECKFLFFNPFQLTTKIHTKNQKNMEKTKIKKTKNHTFFHPKQTVKQKQKKKKKSTTSTK